MLLIAVVPGCSSRSDAATQIAVVINSDLEVGREISEIQVTVTSPDGETLGDMRAFVLPVDGIGDGQSALPISFGLVPPKRNPAEQFLITVVGMLDEEAVVSQSAIGRFGERRTLLLQVFLGRVCLRKLCTDDDGTTCYVVPSAKVEAGQCGPVQERSLPEIKATEATNADGWPEAGWRAAEDDADASITMDAGESIESPDGTTDETGTDSNVESGSSAPDAQAAPQSCRNDQGIRCDDNNPCNGQEACAPDASVADSRGCVLGSAVSCSADQACDPSSGQCSRCAGNAAPKNWYRDADGDAHGDLAVMLRACTQPPAYVPFSDDCDDSRNARFPGNAEICDGLDNNCTGGVDESAPAPEGCVAIGGTASCGPEGTCARSCNGRTICGDRCVDLASDEDNCGACGYSVVSAGRAGEPALRTCVGGQPTPGWASISSLGAPTDMSGTPLVAWSGKRLLFVHSATSSGDASRSAVAYSPSNDTWRSVAAPPTVIPYFNGALSSWVAASDRNQIFVWRGDSSGGSPAAYIFDDSGSAPSWIEVGASGAPGHKDAPSLVYDGSAVHVLFGSPPDTSGRYNLAFQSWSTSTFPTNYALCGQGPRIAAQAAYAGGRIVAAGGYAASGAWCSSTASILRFDPVSATWDTTPSDLARGRAAMGLLSLGTRALAYGGWAFCNGASCNVAEMEIVDPLLGNVRVAEPPAPALATLRSSTFGVLLYTGRAVLVWGGIEVNRDGIGTGQMFSGGSMGLVNGDSVAWTILPTTNAPSNRYGVGAVTQYQYANSQHLWTGREALVWGGVDASGNGVANGARYQPPVGCVCPRSANQPPGVATICDQVSSIGPSYANCSPQ